MPKTSHRNARRARAQTRRGREVAMYPVYANEDVAGQTPLFHIDKETRDIWVEQGALCSMSRGKGVRLMRNLLPRTQQSSSMGPSIIVGNAGGKEYAQACALAWRRGVTPVMAGDTVVANRAERMAA